MRKNLLQSLSKDRSNSAFTLLELLIVFGVVSILSVAVITVINPGELLLSTRDGKRMSDLSTLNRILGLYLVNEGSSFGSASTIYISLPSDNPDCSDLELPELQSPYSYHCQTEANHKKVDGNGWVPVDLTTIPLGTPMSSLPTDPVNDNQYYYTYTPDPSNRTWELTAPIVSLSKKKYAQNDGGNDPNLFEIGANLISSPQIAYVYNPLEDQVFTGIGVVYAQSTPLAGQVSYFTDATHVAGTNNLFWDTTNARLGIGTATPGQKLTVAGTVESTSGGFKFPDSTTQTTAASSGVTLPSGAVFMMITGSCPAGTTDVSATYSNKFVRINATAGSTGGSDTVALAEANLPSHTHGVGTLTIGNESAHTHTFQKSAGGSSGGGPYWGNTSYALQNVNTSAGTAHTHTLSGSTGSTGSGTAVTITNPYVTAKMCQVN